MAERKELNKVNKRIDINDYRPREYASWFLSFDKKRIIIELEDGTIYKCTLAKNILPHLIGLQYAYDKTQNKQKYKGENGFDLLMSETYSFKEFEKNVKKNIKFLNENINYEALKLRLEYLPMFMNTLSKNSKFRVKTSSSSFVVKSGLKGKYFIYKNEEKLFLVFSLIELNNKKCAAETFIVNDNIGYLGLLEEMKIKSIKIE